jgi:hypothetical protein
MCEAHVVKPLCLLDCLVGCRARPVCWMVVV